MNISKKIIQKIIYGKKIENNDKKKIELKQNKGHINKINLGLTISSIKLMKKIFSHINIKKQLKLMKYSKAIQTKNCINIEDYKNLVEGI